MSIKRMLMDTLEAYRLSRGSGYTKAAIKACIENKGTLLTVNDAQAKCLCCEEGRPTDLNAMSVKQLSELTALEIKACGPFFMDNSAIDRLFGEVITHIELLEEELDEAMDNIER